MSTHIPADTTERNLTLAFDLLRAIGDDPSILNEIPDGVAVVLIPHDDPALAEANIELAIQTARTGQNVYIKRTA